jgi:anaerobic ribonucleoside-triphosphate reductase activating protein
MSQEAFLEVSRAHYPVTVLGPGRRIGLWVQGCSIGCSGCVSQDTWAQDASRSMTVSHLLAWCREMAAGGLDGITISGGEPFDQADGLLALLDGLTAWRAQAQIDFDILCYSGYPWKQLQKRHPAVLAKLDAVVPEPFNQHAMPGLKWRGSSNQTLITLSLRGERVFFPWIDAAAVPEMQVAVNDGKVWLIGIPPHGGMDNIMKSCSEKGLQLKEVSWQP